MDEEERYEIQGKIGEGGLGSIYRAYDRQLNRTVAVKRIHPDPKADPEEAFQAILKESRALSALSSTNIVSVFDIDQDEDGPYVVMEFLEGETLEELVDRAPLVEADFMTASGQALEGLIAAHEQNIIHRDIKPSNLMFTWLPSGRFQLKILDFGLAKFSKEPAVQTMAHGNSLMGSIYFMAPEQFSRQPLDARTDLYSLGCVLYYSITANHPFEGDTAGQVMAGHIQGNYPPLDHIRPDLRPELLRWLDCLMACDPDDRFDSAQSALDTLEEIKITAPPVTITGPIPQAAPPADTHPTLATGPIPPAPQPPEASAPLPQNPLTVKLPTTGLPVWLLVGVGTLAAGILILSLIALNSDQLAPRKTPPTEAPLEAPATTSESVSPAIETFERLLLRHDKNGDGKLTLQEFPHPKETKKEPQFSNKLKKLDTNKNSTLEPSELFRSTQHREGVAQTPGINLKEFSQNREKQAGVEVKQRFTDLDLDASKTLSAEELELGELIPWDWK
jgi:serine/threonine protein kinase